YHGQLLQRQSHKAQRSLLINVVDLQVGERTHAARTPVDDTLASINQPFFIEAHKHFAHSLRQALVQGKALTGPIARNPQPALLVLNAMLILMYPLPDALKECFAANSVSVCSLFRQQALHDSLRSYTGMIFAGYPQR